MSPRDSGPNFDDDIENAEAAVHVIKNEDGEEMKTKDGIVVTCILASLPIQVSAEKNDLQIFNS